LSRRLKRGEIERIKTPEGKRYRVVSREQRESRCEASKGREVRGWDFDFEVSPCEASHAGELDLFQAPDDDESRTQGPSKTPIGIFGGLTMSQAF
jgi:hypothetical protein